MIMMTIRKQSRYEDMSREGQLILEETENSFIIAIVFDDDSHSMGLEFTTPFAGGGQSDNTWRLLGQQYQVNDVFAVDGQVIRIMDDQDGDMYIAFFSVEKNNNQMSITMDKQWLYSQLEFYLFFDGLMNAMEKDNQQRIQYRGD